MPYRRRRFGRRRRLPIGGFPRTMMAKLRYSWHGSFNPGAGGIATNSFRANSIYDPDATGAGSQPSNHDRFEAIYDRYTVVGARIMVEPIYAAGTNANPSLAMVKLSELGTDLATAHAAGGVNNCIEQPLSKFSSKNWGVINSWGNKRIWSTYSQKRFFGVKGIGTSPYSAEFGNNPTEGAFFEVALMSPDDASDPGAQQVRVVIEYICVFSELKLADAS